MSSKEEAGKFPFTRGIHPGMYTTRLWTMRQYAGFGTAEETNARFHQLLQAGQTGLSTAFDLPTQMGYDSDHPMAAGEVGRVGVAIDTVDDLADLFKGIPLDQVTTNATAATLLAMYVVVGEEQGVARNKLGGTIQNDILKEYIARGTYIYPAAPSLRLTADVFRFVVEEKMNFNPISISGYHRRSPSPSRTGWSTSSTPLRPGCRCRDSGRGCRSSSPRTTTSSRRSPSSGRRGACGRRWCASGSGPMMPPRACGSTPRPAG